MQISNVKIYDLEESILASGYPMSISISPRPLEEKDWKRTKRLVEATVTDNQAHGQFLTGIRVAFDLRFTNKAWVEAERYRFLEFVSSQSTMHRICKFPIAEQCCHYVDPRVIAIVQELVDKYNEDPCIERYLAVLYNVPSGFELTARLTTDYRCLRNIYKQRKNHRLPEWREFCKWIETLPYAEQFLVN